MGGVFGRAAVEELSPRSPEGLSKSALATAVDEGARAIREQAPTQVDDDTTLTEALAAGTEIMYTMTLKMDLTDAEIADGQPRLQRQNQERICAEERARRLVEAGATMTHIYTDSSGDLFKTSVSDCP